MRRGAQNLERKGKALEELRLAKGIESYEKQTVNVPLSVVTESDAIKQFVKHVVPHQEPKAFLKKQNLIRGNKPTVAAVLLFAEEPQAALPKRSGVKLYRYKTTGAPTREALAGTPQSIEGPIHELIKKSVHETVAMIEGIQKLGSSGLEPVKYPFETLHEIVTNAILHRDYSIAADVLIRIFDNRVEMESPDPPNKDVGEGLNTAFNAMQKLRLKPPVIEEPDNSVLVLIRHDLLASPEESVMDYLQNHAQIKNGIARQLTGITSENSMKDVFLRMAKSELIERVPNKKGAAAAWQKKAPVAP